MRTMSRSNQYPGRCCLCGMWLDAHQGVLSAGKVIHSGACAPRALPDTKIESAFQDFSARRAVTSESPLADGDNEFDAFKVVIRQLLHEQRMAT